MRNAFVLYVCIKHINYWRLQYCVFWKHGGKGKGLVNGLCYVSLLMALVIWLLNWISQRMRCLSHVGVRWTTRARTRWGGTKFLIPDVEIGAWFRRHFLRYDRELSTQQNVEDRWQVIYDSSENWLISDQAIAKRSFGQSLEIRQITLSKEGGFCDKHTRT
jgi:hypothetical protein